MYSHLKYQMEEMQKIADRMNAIVKPAIEAHRRTINSPSFKVAIKARQEQMEYIKRIYNSTPWKNIVKQQLESQKIILSAFSKIDTVGLSEYRNFLQKTFYTPSGNINLEKPSRIELEQVEDSIDQFKEKAKKKEDKETLEIIKEVEKKFDLNGEDKFIIFFSAQGILYPMGDKKNSINITSSKLIELISTLANSNSYIPTDSLEYRSGYTNIRSVRNAISTLRDKFKDLGFTNGNPIDGKQGHGYILHRNIRLMIDPNENF